MVHGYEIAPRQKWSCNHKEPLNEILPLPPTPPLPVLQYNITWSYVTIGACQTLHKSNSHKRALSRFYAPLANQTHCYMRHLSPLPPYPAQPHPHTDTLVSDVQKTHGGCWLRRTLARGGAGDCVACGPTGTSAGVGVPHQGGAPGWRGGMHFSGVTMDSARNAL